MSWAKWQLCICNVEAAKAFVCFVKDFYMSELTLSETDRICRICLKTIKCFLRFLNKCLDVEKNLAQKHGNSENASGSLDLDKHIEIVENIQIVVEDDLQEYFMQTTTNIEDSTENIEHDHAYIKLEGEEVEMTSHQAFGLESNAIFIQETIGESDDISNNDSLMKHEDSEDDELQENDNDSENDSSCVTREESGATAAVRCIKEEDLDTNDSIVLGAEDVTFYEPLETENIYICELCGEGFLSETLLKEHLVLHEGVTIICDKCPKIFKNTTALKAHYKLKHTDAERYKCDICQQTFARADYLRNHQKRHEEDTDPSKVKCRVPGKFLRFKNTDEPLPCKLCGKYYNGIQKLKVHLQTHLIVKRYKCEYCDLTYKRWPSLKRHEKSHLESNRVFHRCNVCWKRFNTEVELEAHMTQHGNPRYRCQICDEYFHRKYLFDNHYLLKHATEEDIENSKKEIVYDTLLELSNQHVLDD
ncbi:hypothetical protein JTB14_021311 [Gonioctena quinquepunctata]|nr:hypothetical protein JTB14_021311 [Gonioctena quinquepunctata]